MARTRLRIRKRPGSVLTVEQVCTAYLATARAGQVLTRFRRPNSASTIEIDQGRVSRHIVPLIGPVPVTALDRRKVQGMVDDIASGKTAGIFKTKAEKESPRLKVAPALRPASLSCWAEFGAGPRSAG